MYITEIMNQLYNKESFAQKNTVLIEKLAKK